MPTDCPADALDPGFLSISIDSIFCSKFVVAPLTLMVSPTDSDPNTMSMATTLGFAKKMVTLPTSTSSAIRILRFESTSVYLWTICPAFEILWIHPREYGHLLDGAPRKRAPGRF